MINKRIKTRLKLLQNKIPNASIRVGLIKVVSCRKREVESNLLVSDSSTLFIYRMLEKPNVVDLSGTGEFDSTNRFRDRNSPIRNDGDASSPPGPRILFQVKSMPIQQATYPRGQMMNC